MTVATHRCAIVVVVAVEEFERLEALGARLQSSKRMVTD